MSSTRPERSVYWLGAIPASKWLNRRRVLAIVALAGVTVVLLVLLAITQSVWLLLATGLAGLGILMAWGKTDAYGGQWLTSVVGEAVRSRLARAGGWDEFHPAHEPRPWLLGKVRIASVTAPGAGDGELGLIDLAEENAMVAVLEIDGDGEGIRPMYQHRRIESNIGRLLNKLCDPRQVPSQVDFIVRATPPVSPDFRRWTEKHLRPDVTPQTAGSMHQMAEEAERRASTLRAWVAIRMPIDALADRARLEGRRVDAEVIAEVAYEVTSEVTRILGSHEVTVLRGLSVQQLAAVVRGILLPHHDVDSTDNIAGFWDAWPAFQPSERGDALITYDPADPETSWRHSAAVITRDGYPEELVEGRWLEPVVLESKVTHRVVVTQFGLVSHREARLIAKDQLTSASMRLVKQEKLGATSTGEHEDARSLAQAITRDITRYSNAGVIPVVRVMVSARTPRTLRAAREDLAAADIERAMRVRPDGLRWQDGRQAPAVLRMLPLGLEVSRS